MPSQGDRPPITFASLTSGLLWPRLWRALPMAMRPGRLFVAFIMLVTLLLGGSVYDGVSAAWTGQPAVAGAGLDADHPPEERVQENLRLILSNSTVVDPDRASALLEQETVKAGQVRRAVIATFRDRAKSLRREEDRRVSAVEWDRIRTPYRAAVRDTRLLEGYGLFELGAVNTVKAFNEAALGLVSLEPGRAARAVDWWWTRTAKPLFNKHPFGGALILLLLVATMGLAGGAIARTTACDVAGWPAPGPADSIGFAWRRRFDFCLSLLGPALFIGGIALLLAVIGAVALRIPGIDVLAAILYGGALLLGLMAALTVLGLLVGGLMLLPAVAVECTDWLDGVQRVYAYVAGAPGRLLMYLLALAVQGLLAYWALSLVVAGAMNFAGGATTSWLGAKPAPLAGGIEPFVFEIQPDSWALWGTSAGAANVMGLWELVFALLLAAGVFSFLFTAGTLLYLAMRQINDHQDMADISVDTDD